MANDMGAGQEATERFTKAAQLEFSNQPSPGELSTDPVLAFFDYPKPQNGKITAAPFGKLALEIARGGPRNAERTVALRKLLEASDAAKRASFDPEAATKLAEGGGAD